MEGHGGDLEAEPDEQEHQADQQHAVGQEHVLGQEGRDAGEVGRPRGAVDEGDAVEEEGRREGAEHEVLEPRLLGLGAVALHGGHDVGRDRQDLEAEEDHDEVVGHGHDQPAGGGQEHEDVVLGPVQLLPAQVRVADQRGQDHRAADDHGQEHRELVDGDRAGDGRRGALVADAVPQVDGRADAAGGGEHRERGVEAPEQVVLHQRGEEDEQDGADGQDDQGQQRRPRDVRGVEGLGGVELGEEGDHPCSPPSGSETSTATPGPMSATGGCS